MTRLKRLDWYCWLLLGVTTNTWAQAPVIQAPTQYSAEAGTYFSSSERTPFWLRSNQYGIVPLKSPVATLRAGVYSDYDSSRLASRRLAIGYGLNVVANAGASRQLLLPEAYVKARLGPFEFYAGRRREIFGLVDSTLSSGSYAWSGNALPIPKVQFGIPQFTPIGFTKGWVSVMGQYAHGWFSGTGYVQNAFLHQKTAYVRLGRPQDVVRLFGGMNHQAVWGGYSEDLVGTGLVTSANLPSSLRDYWYTVTAKRGTRPDTSLYTQFDITNRVGNHLGTVDAGIEIDLTRVTLFAYRQNIYEDGSLFYLTNIADGLNGLRIRRNNPDALVREVLIEFLNTTSQGGPEFVIDDDKRRGKDDYFNNAQFRDGWSYQCQGIGTPFIPPALGPNGECPYGGFTLNNRVQVWHLGLQGSLPLELERWLAGRIQYQTKLSYSNNLGTYNAPYPQPRRQFSAWLNLVVPFRSGFNLTSSLAADSGELYTNSVGVYVGIRKTWLTAANR